MNYKNLRKAEPANGRRHAVYTAIFGDYDELIEPHVVDESCDYICFTDSVSINSPNWRIINCPCWHEDPVRAAKAYKILPHIVLPKHEKSIWIDGNIVPITDLLTQAMDVYLLRHEYAFFSHPERECIYDELQACIQLSKDDPDLMKRQVLSYIKQGFPPHFGLIFGGVIFRNHKSSLMRDVSEAWWEEIVNGSRRDQLCFDFIRWKNSFDIEWIDYKLIKNPLFFVTFHGKNKDR